MLFASFALSAADSLALADVLFASFTLSAAAVLAVSLAAFASLALVSADVLAVSLATFASLALVSALFLICNIDSEFFCSFKDALFDNDTTVLLASLRCVSADVNSLRS